MAEHVADFPIDVQPRVNVPMLRIKPSRDLILLIPVAVFMALALLLPSLVGSPTAQSLTHRLQEPHVALGGTAGWAGTDSLGRDMLARIVSGAQRSLIIGITVSGMASAIGLALGLGSGFFGGWFDALVTAVSELVVSVPTIVIGIVLVSVLGQGMGVLIVLLVLSGWIGMARVTRLQVRTLRLSDFVLASKASGASPAAVAWRHVLPNVLPVAVTMLLQQVGAVMLWEASLTYLGIGLPTSTISLGGLVKDGQDHVFDAWWLSVFPGLAIAWAVIGFMLLASLVQRWLVPGAPRPWRRASVQHVRDQF